MKASTPARSILLALASALLPLLLIEVVLHFLPVNDGLRVCAVNEQSPVLHFEPNRTSTWSEGFDFARAHELRSNNHGFLNTRDYRPDARSPLVAVIGDSYVEAAMIAPENTFHELLRRGLREARVYSFGASGAPLSQYLAYAAYCAKKFRPQKMIVAIIGNDFDESILQPGSMPGFHYFREHGDGALELVRKDYTPSPLKRLARHSSLARYLLLNLHAGSALSRLKGLVSEQPQAFVGQTAAGADEARVAFSERAVHAFLERIPQETGLGPEDILLVVDGIRPQLYDEAQLEQTGGSYIAVMRNLFMNEARERGYQVLDLQPVFIARNAQDGARFEFADDAHWNEHGHEVVADSILDSGFLDDLR